MTLLMSVLLRSDSNISVSYACAGEFTGLDLEMAINEHYNEVLLVAHNMFKHIFQGLESR
jgi:aspartyl/asparaginyl-tRNA synthetase